MKRALKDAWVTALRSDEFVQTQGLLHQLYDDDGNEAEGFCCLGVLCEVAIREGLPVESEAVGKIIKYRVAGADGGSWCTLNDDLLKLFGLSQQDELVNMNDGAGTWMDRPQDFATIADVIEQIVPVED